MNQGRDEARAFRGEHDGPEAHRVTDDPLDSLLDDALAPPAELPRGFTERLVAASVEASAEARLDAAQPLAMTHEGSRRFPWSQGLSALAAAAAIALVMFGAWALFEPTTPEPAPTDGLALLERELGDLDHAAAVRVDPMDERIELLALQLELTQAGSIWPAGEPLEELARDAQTYQLFDEWDLAWAY